MRCDQSSRCGAISTGTPSSSAMIATGITAQNRSSRSQPPSAWNPSISVLASCATRGCSRSTCGKRRRGPRACAAAYGREARPRAARTASRHDKVPDEARRGPAKSSRVETCRIWRPKPGGPAAGPRHRRGTPRTSARTAPRRTAAPLRAVRRRTDMDWRKRRVREDRNPPESLAVYSHSALVFRSGKCRVFRSRWQGRVGMPEGSAALRMG